ncbi:MAG TPA: CDP-alcohol phosphatidyltransferase family protein [Planctomycetota bacterium]|nr:CDP-alcohol phosphatidyltransferase family protein [Planctomycetota bacterium]
MPSIYDLKPKFQNLLRPILRVMHGMGISPNAITLMALALSFATGVAVYYSKNPNTRWLLLVPPAALFVRMALNALDGMMAREYKLFSDEGKILNEFGDLLADTAIYLPLWFTVADPAGPGDWQLKATRWAILGFVLLAILSEFAGVLAVDLCGKRLYQGPGGKSDRAFLVGLYTLVLFFAPDLARFTLYYFGFLDLLVVLSIRNRLVAALRLAHEKAAAPPSAPVPPTGAPAPGPSTSRPLTESSAGD